MFTLSVADFVFGENAKETNADECDLRQVDDGGSAGELRGDPEQSLSRSRRHQLVARRAGAPANATNTATAGFHELFM